MLNLSIMTLVLATQGLTAKAPSSVTLHCTNDPDKLTVVEVDETTSQLRVMTNGGDEIKGAATVTRSGDDVSSTVYLLPFQLAGLDAPSHYTLRKTVTITKAGEETNWVLLERAPNLGGKVASRPCSIAK
jgi:hypothetical protein